MKSFRLLNKTSFVLIATTAITSLQAATVSIRSYGGNPNDGQSDRAALDLAAAAAGTGGTIIFPAGVYDFGTTRYTLASDRIYQGESGATLRGKSSDGEGFYIKGDNVKVIGLTFDAGGFFLDSPNGKNKNIVFDYNVFRMNTSGTHSSCITFTSGLQDSKITNNYFTTNGNNAFGLYGYNYRRLTIANNEFVNIGAGMHIDAFSDSGDLLVEQNLVSGAKGMGFEFQSTASNLKFYDNYYVSPNLSTTFNNNNNSMAFSLILDKSSNIEIKRNAVLAPNRPDGVGTRIGFELGGDNSLTEDNYINGVNHVAAMNDGVGTASVTFRKNRVLNYLQSWSCSFCSGSTRTWSASDNGPNTQLTWDINRPLPGIGAKRYGGANNPPPVPTPSPTPNPTTPLVASLPTDGGVFISDMNFSFSNFWGPVEKDKSNGEQGSGDGRTIQLGDKTYSKGLGVHATSTITVALKGKYESFKTKVGIDGESGSNGSANLEVIADGQTLYNSGRFTGGSNPLDVDVSIKGKQYLTLKVTDAGDNSDADHVSLGFARLLVDPNAVVIEEEVDSNDPANASTFAGDSTDVRIEHGMMGCALNEKSSAQNLSGMILVLAVLSAMALLFYRQKRFQN